MEPPPHSDNVGEELHRVQMALLAVFSPPTTNNNAAVGGRGDWWNQRQLADRFLTTFQTTPVAWMVCDQLLQGGNTDTNTNNNNINNNTTNTNATQQQQQARFFAAQTLHLKCRSDMHQLPVEARASLRDALWQHLTRCVSSSSMGSPGNGSGNSSEALMNRLAMCVSALAVQMKWTTIVDDLIRSAAAAAAAEATTTNNTLGSAAAALAVLRSLPEECASERLFLEDDTHRFAMRDHLVASAPLMFSFLQSIVQQQQAEHNTNNNTHSFRSAATATRVLKTFHTWIRFVPVRPESLVESPLLLPLSVQVMSSPQPDDTLMEVAADVLVEVLHMYPSHHSNNVALVQHMIPALLQLPLDDALQSEDEDVLQAYCRVVTEMGESYMSMLLYTSAETAPTASQLLEGVLRCSRIPDAEISGMTLTFWYNLVTEIEGLEPYEWRQSVIDNYTPHLLTLIQVCASNLMRYPADFDHSSSSTPDATEDLDKHRLCVEETVEDCCRLLGGQLVREQMDRLLREQVQTMAAVAAATTPTKPQPSSEWQGLESCLACLCALRQFLPSDEAETLPYCFHLIPQLPSDIRPLRITACKFIGKYASWLARQSSEMLELHMSYLTFSLSLPDCAPSAAIAIKEICASANLNTGFAEPVLHLYENLFSQQGGNIDHKDELQILEGVCRVLSRTIQDTRSDGKQFVARLSQPAGNRLANIVNDANSSPKRIVAEVERLTVIIRFLTVPYFPPDTHPMIELLQSLWALLESASIRFPHDTSLAEAICRLHKYVIRTLGAKAYVSMLDALMKQLVESFERTRQSPFLYAASICISEFGKDPAYTQKLYDMVALLATTFFAFNRNLEELTNHPDVVEEFFYLISKMISYCPDPVVTSPLLHTVAQCAVVGMEMDHRGASKGTFYFLDSTVSYGLELRALNKPENEAALATVITQQGQAIVNNLAKVMMQETSTRDNKIPEILWKMSSLCRSMLMQWLTIALASTHTAPERAKSAFMDSLDNAVTKDEFNLVVQSFQTACDRDRRVRRMQQVRE